MIFARLIHSDFSCISEIFGPPVVFPSSQILQVDDHVSVTASGRIVRLERARVSDTGRYTCVATNVAGEDEKDFDVNVQGERGQLVCWLGWVSRGVLWFV